MSPKTYLLPLSKEEVIMLAAIVAAALTAIDTTAYTNEVQRKLMQAQKPQLESIKNKLTKVR